MKKILLLLTVLTLLIPGAAFAVTAPQPVLYSENPVVTAVPVLISTNPSENLPMLIDYDTTLTEQTFQVISDGTAVTYDVLSQNINGVTMLPLRHTLETLGYSVNWNSSTMSVDIIKGARFTSITLGENRYFKNKMAPISLSAAPIAINGRTMLPLEFFYETLDEVFVVDSNDVIFKDDMMAKHAGFVLDMSQDETGLVTYTIVSDLEQTDLEFQTIIHTNQFFTYTQKQVSEGDFITALCSPVMTMSIPGQTSAYVIY